LKREKIKPIEVARRDEVIMDYRVYILVYELASPQRRCIENVTREHHTKEKRKEVDATHHKNRVRGIENVTSPSLQLQAKQKVQFFFFSRKEGNDYTVNHT
jgi:hypothetical protein